MSTIDSVKSFIAALAKVSRLESVQVRRLDLSTGDVQLDVQVDHSYFYQVLSEKCGLTIANERQLMEQILQLVTVKQRFARFEQALADVENSGYGIVMPAMDEMHLDEPEIMKQGGPLRCKATSTGAFHSYDPPAIRTQKWHPLWAAKASPGVGYVPAQRV